MTTWRGKRVPHDTLWQLATYHCARISEKLARDDRVGIGFDGMSAVIALAFSVEAILNFVGQMKLGEKWDERARYSQKVKHLEKHLDFKYNKTDQPYSTLEALKDARDKMAHGKPVEFLLFSVSKKKITAAMQPEWSSLTSPENALLAFDETRVFKEFLFRKARIKRGAQFGSAMVLHE